MLTVKMKWKLKNKLSWNWDSFLLKQDRQKVVIFITWIVFNIFDIIIMWTTYIHVYRNPDITSIKYVFYIEIKEEKKWSKLYSIWLKSDCIERKTKIVKTNWVNHLYINKHNLSWFLRKLNFNWIEFFIKYITYIPKV